MLKSRMRHSACFLHSFFTFLKLENNYLKGKQTDGPTGTFFPLVYFPDARMAKDGPGPSQELGTQSRSPTQGAEAQGRDPSGSAPLCRKLGQKQGSWEAGQLLNGMRAAWAASVLHQMPTQRPRAPGKEAVAGSVWFKSRMRHHGRDWHRLGWSTLHVARGNIGV